MNENKSYIAIDLKSFYASVECVRRGLDPLVNNLVVADKSRTEKTICLAVSPSLKAYGIPGRARLFEVIQKVKEVNGERRAKAPNHKFREKSFYDPKLREDPSLELDFIIAPPQMAKYMEISTKIYEIYLKYIAPEDIHVYSIDEVFIDATKYLRLYGLSPKELAMKMIKDVLSSTGITATAGIGTNLFLCKVAMDIVAKHIPADENGVRIAELDEMSFREKLWDHTPLTDFWRIGRGYSKKLEAHGLYTMGDIALCSVGKPDEYYNEDLLYKLFGINAELLIDHAWGWEPTEISEIKAYRPETNSISSGQVLQCPYTAEKGRLVVREMADSLVLDLVEKGLVCSRVDLTVCYDIENAAHFKGEMKEDFYGRTAPKNAHGSLNLGKFTSSSRLIIDAVTELYDSIVNKELTVRRFYVVADNVIHESDVKEEEFEQLDLFTDYEAEKKKKEEDAASLEKEKKMQQAILSVKKRYGKNAILKGMNYEEGATARERNGTVGGHKA
ncbi:MAG: DNA methylase [Clostridia bacterium]|nr:DNA methylase [Clostridia bacterium]